MEGKLRCSGPLLEYAFHYFEPIIILCDEKMQLIWCNQSFLLLSNLDQIPVGLSIKEWVEPDLLQELEGMVNESFDKKTAMLTFCGTATPFKCAILRRSRQYLIVADGAIYTDSDVVEQMSKINNEMINMNREIIRKNVELEKANARIRQLMTTDYLTGLATRRCTHNFLSRALSYFKRTQSPVAIILLDIDFFKQINDMYGHLMGDKVLVKLSKLIKKFARNEDLVARFGGEEFIIALPGTDISGAKIFAERLRKKTEQLNVSGMTSQVTISLGVTAFLHSDTIDSAIQRADQALYLAKGQGRNKVVAL